MEMPELCVIGLTTERLADIRNRMNSLKETKSPDYTNLENIRREVEEAKIFLENINGQPLM